MYEGRCWKFNVSTVSGLLSFDLANFMLHRLLLELLELGWMANCYCWLVGFVAWVTVIVFMKIRKYVLFIL